MNQQPERDAKLAHELITEHFDRDNLGRLRTVIATALTTARTEGHAAGRAEAWKEAIEIADELEYELPQFQQMQGCEAVRKKMQERLALEQAAKERVG